MKAKRKPSALVAELAAAGSSRAPRWELTKQALEDIADARAVNEAGERYIPLVRLAAALRERDKYPVSVKAVGDRIRDHVGGRW